jgi:hypothetical protein
MATWYVDLEASASGNGNSFATRTSNINTIVNTSATGGDEVRVMASVTPTAVGPATFNNLGTITIPSNTVKVLYTDGAWTAAANVTATANTTTRKQGANAAQLAIAAGFTTGLVGYYDTGVTNNLSSYTKVSFWFRSSVAIANASLSYSFRLCSDASGAVPVNTLTFPAMAIAANTWVPIVIDNTLALSTTVRSVSLFAIIDPGTATVILDNVMVANSVTLRTLVSSNETDGPWFAVRSITNDASVDTIITDIGLNSSASVASKGYYGSTDSATAYFSDGISLGASAAAANTTTIFNFTKVAPAAYPITISGGWDRTAMSTSGGYTHINGINSNGRIISLTNAAYLNISNLVLSNAYTGFYISSDNCTFDKCHVSNIIFYGILGNLARTGLTISSSNINSCSTATLSIIFKNNYIQNCSFLNSTDGVALGANASVTDFKGCTFANNVNTGFTIPANSYSSGITFEDCSFSNNSTYGLEILEPTQDLKIINGTMNSNGTSAIYAVRANATILGLSTTGNNNTGITPTGIGNFFYINNWVFSESTPIVAGGLANYDNSVFISVNHGGTADEHRIFTDGGTIYSETSIRSTSNGIAWRLQPTSTIRSSIYPLVQPIKGIPVKANVAHTFSVQARRNNTGLTLNFGIPQQTIAGITAQEVSMTAAADTWQQLSLTVTPTRDAVVDLYVSAYGGTSWSGYWDSFTVSAASKNNVLNGDYGYYGSGVYATNYQNERATISVG